MSGYVTSRLYKQFQENGTMSRRTITGHPGDIDGSEVYRDEIFRGSPKRDRGLNYELGLNYPFSTNELGLNYPSEKRDIPLSLFSEE
ncbi:hypothetical protein TNCV_2638321 [Trichonephila clavipes]|nr:hypothetical protein TNCV_2638321 [Trichonephila clavipes]